MKCITWNVRGLRDDNWRGIVGQYLREWGGGGYHMPAENYDMSGGSAILVDIRKGGSRSVHTY